MALKTGAEPPARIPFWRNVKLIGIFLQIIFAVAVVILGFILYSNVTDALSRTRIPANFNFLGARAGIPIAETPIQYTPNDSYSKALFIGLLNTLRVSVIGVVLATLLGVLVGVMRLSGNFLARQIATGYVELIRNTPLAVQIIFWFTAVLSVIPPLSSNPWTLPGGALVSNIGIALPWLFATYSFAAWIPWLVAALVLALGVWFFRRRQFRLADRPGRAWPAALAVLVLVAGLGYFIVDRGSGVPDGMALDYLLDRGRGIVYIDANGDGIRNAGEEYVPYASVLAGFPLGTLSATSTNLVESGRAVNSTFRFPLLRPGEFEEAEVTFVNEEDAARFSIHFTAFPSRGIIYEDRNGNGEWDAGEEINEETGIGFTGRRLLMTVTEFERHLVADRDGQVRLPRFEAVALPDAPVQDAGGARPGQLFAPPAPAASEPREGDLEFRYQLLAEGPLVLSRPDVSVSTYDGGVRMTTSYLAMLLSLVIYTAAFMAEIVRGGIQAVPRGQSEAARALGLKNDQVFSFVVFPQALRIILPPMISQYLNLTKNSSLAPLAAYGELFAISVIVANQTGASVPVTLLLIVSYVVISLVFALVLNIVNARVSLVER